MDSIAVLWYREAIYMIILKTGINFDNFSVWFTVKIL